jgi:hypothetical protein
METILLRGDSKSNAKLLRELAKKLNFSAKKLSAKEAEEIGLDFPKYLPFHTVRL